jgi:hypothetical protein
LNPTPATPATSNNILYEFYKPELANEYMKTWNEALVSPQVEYDTVQSAW